MDTNVIERAIRPVTITRKNSLFANPTPKAQRRRAFAYLADVLQWIISRRTKNHALHALLPWNWHPSRSPLHSAAIQLTILRRCRVTSGHSHARACRSRPDGRRD
jgi:Transposase IS66 family